MRLTSKGQITIPQAIREQLGLLPLTEVVFDVVGDSVRIRKAKTQSRGRQIVEHLRGAAIGRGPGLSTDEIMKLMRGD